MNWKKLYEIQGGLDRHILKEKELDSINLIDDKFLALNVEVGELANEWRGFKFWKVDPQPNVDKIVDCSTCVGTGDENAEANLESLMEEKGSLPFVHCESCDGTGVSHHENPMLIEYVDCLHFILSIGNDIGIQIKNIRTDQHKERTLTKQFNRLFREISNFHLDRSFINYFRVMNVYLALGEMLDFTQEEIEKAYMIKNLENHKRQRRGY